MTVDPTIVAVARFGGATDQVERVRTLLSRASAHDQALLLEQFLPCLASPKVERLAPRTAD